MKTFCLVFFLTFELITTAKVHPKSKMETLVFTKVSLIDVTGGVVKSNMTVVVTGRNISLIGETDKVRVPRGARVIDCSGKFLIPGMWDMHVHWYDKNYLPLFTGNGVTGIRVMWGFPMHLEWRKGIEQNTLLGPRMFIASPVVDGPNPTWPGSTIVTNENDGREAVRNLKKDGADFIKVYDMIPREAYFAIADESKKQRITFAGHVPITVSAEEASDAGQKSMEHLGGILGTCSTQEDELRKEREELFLSRPEGQQEIPREKLRSLTRRTLETFSEEKATKLFLQFRKNQTWQCPTLIVLRNVSVLDDPELAKDPRLKYMPQNIKLSWNPRNDFRFRTKTAEDFDLGRQAYAKQFEIVGMMQAAGVQFLAGTDALNPYVVPGFSLHDELALLVKAGLSPAEALRSATYNPAVFLGMADSLGTLEPGKIADMVMLDANPLEDISHTTKIYAVMVAGKLFDRHELDSMMARVERIANRKSIANVMYTIMVKESPEEAIKKYRELRATQFEDYNFGESELNNLGYGLLQSKRITDAIEVFRLNVEFYPDSFNVYDSLGEAYMINGDVKNAIENYKRSVELNPENENGIEKLKSLEKL